MFVWNIDPNLFHLPDFIPGIGGRGIRYYGVIYALVFLGGFQLFQWQILRSGRSREVAERFLTLGVIAVIGGARLGHCLFYEPDKYLSDPIRILYFWEGGLASHGTTIAIIFALIYFARKEGISISEILDRISLSIGLGATLIRIGNFMNSEIVGRVAGQGIGVKFPRHDFYYKGVSAFPCPNTCDKAAEFACAEFPVRQIISGKVAYVDQCVSLANVPWRHASQLYEVLLGVIVIIVLWVMDRKWGEKRPVGLMGFTFLALYFTGRFIVEFFKEYQSLEARESILTMGQYLSLPFILIGTVGIYVSLKRWLPTNEQSNYPAQTTK